MAQYKRRLIPIVDRQFQFKYTALVVAVAAFVACVLGWFLLDSYREMNEIMGVASVSPAVNDMLLSDDATKVFRITIVVLVLEVVVLGVLGLLITHRVAGPVFVLTRYLNEIQQGSYPTIRPLRAEDEFRETFESFKAMVEMLRTRDSSDVEKLRAAIQTGKAKGMSDEELAPLQALLQEKEARVAPKAG